MAKDSSKPVFSKEGQTVCDENLFFVEKNGYARLLQSKQVSAAASTITLLDIGTGASTAYSYANGTATILLDSSSHTLSNINPTTKCFSTTDITSNTDGYPVLEHKYNGRLVIKDYFLFFPSFFQPINN